MTAQGQLLKSLIADVDAYCASAGLSISDFGEAAVNDRSLMHDLKRGKRSPRLVTIDKIRAYIAANPAPSTDTATDEEAA